MTVGELIERLGGDLLHGDPTTVLTGVDRPGMANSGDLVFGDSAESAADAAASGASAVVVPQDFIPSLEREFLTVIAATQPRLWFAKAAKLLAMEIPVSGIHPTAVISEHTNIGEGVSIGAGAAVGSGVTIGAFTRIEAGAVIGDRVLIGSHCRIHARAVVYQDTGIGSRVVIHSGAILGADGFGYVRDRESGTYTQFPQQGTLTIEDDVEIGANTTIDRGALAETRIRRGTKIDNLVHIGHNCDIGEDVVIAALVGISGSSTVGKGAVIAGQVGIGDHAHVGPGVILGGQAGVLSGKTVDTTGTVLWGTPAKPLREYLRELAVLSRLARRKKES